MFKVMAETEHFAKLPCDITVGDLATANGSATVQKPKNNSENHSLPFQSTEIKACMSE